MSSEVAPTNDDLDTMVDAAFADAPAETPAAPAADAPAPAAPAAPAPAQSAPEPAGATPAPAAPRRVLKYKHDHEEVEEDLDRLWEDEKERARIAEALQIHRGWPRVKERERADAAKATAEELAKMVRASGFEFKKTDDGSWVIEKANPGVAMPAGKAVSGPVATPDEDVEALERKVMETGDAEAVAKLTRIARKEAEAAKRQLEEWQASTRKAAEEAAKQQRIASFVSQVEARVANHAKVLDTEELREDAKQVAFAAAFNGAASLEDILGRIDRFAKNVQTRGVREVQSVAASVATPKPSHPPVLTGAPAGAGVQRPEPTKWTQKDMDAEIDAMFGN